MFAGQGPELILLRSMHMGFGSEVESQAIIRTSNEQENSFFIDLSL
jgi:hypothetical protein